MTKDDARDLQECVDFLGTLDLTEFEKHDKDGWGSWFHKIALQFYQGLVQAKLK